MFNTDKEMILAFSNIYSQLQDDLSREIFSNRLLYSLTGDRSYLNNVIRKSCVYEKILQRVMEAKGKLVIYGAGEWGQMFYDFFRTYREFACYIDSYKTGEVNGLKISSLMIGLKRNRTRPYLYAHGHSMKSSMTT